MALFALILVLIVAGSMAAPEFQPAPVPESEEEELESSEADMSLRKRSICLSEHNNQRRWNGKGELHGNGQLEQAAVNHNNYMMHHNCFSHQCPGEPSLGDRVHAAGYRWSGIAENIAMGQGDCNSVMDSWMNSNGHRQNILHNYVHVGCSGILCSNCPNRGPYWTCVFASPA